MDMDITMERLLNDFEGVISQINDIVARKDIDAAQKAMEQIAEIVRADNPDIELDTRTDPNMDHVLHELLSRIDGVIKVKAETETVIEETEEAREAVEQLDIIDQELEIIDITIDQIRREGKSGRGVSNEEEESETTEDKTLEEIDAKIAELNRRRDELNAQFSNPNLADATNVIRDINNIRRQIAELENQRAAIVAAQNVDPNVDIDELTRQIEALRGQISQSDDEINTDIANLQQEIDELIKNATYREVGRETADSFAMRYRNLDINNFQAGTTIRIGNREVTLDPTIHKFNPLSSLDVYGGDNAELGATGEVVLGEIDPEIQRQIEEKRKAIEEKQKVLDDRQSIIDKISELEAQLNAAKNAKNKNARDRIIALEEEIAQLQANSYKEIGRETADSFAMRYRDLDINNFQAGRTIRINNRDIVLDPAKHRFSQISSVDVYGGDEAQLGATGEIVIYEVDPEIQRQIDEKIKEKEELLRGLTPDKSAELAEIDERLNALREQVRDLGDKLNNLAKESEKYKELSRRLESINEQIKALEGRRQQLLLINTKRTKRGPTKTIKSDAKLTEEQQQRIKILLERKRELLLKRKTVEKEVKKHTKTVTKGEDQEYSLTKVARELGDPFFKTHEIRKELAERGVTDEDFLRFYGEGLAKFRQRLHDLNEQIPKVQQEAAKYAVGPNGENLSAIIDNEGTTPADKLKALEMIRKNFFASEEYKQKMIDAGFDHELTEANRAAFEEFYKKFCENAINTFRGMQAEAQSLATNITILEFEIDSINRGREAERLAADGGRQIKAQAKEDKELRRKQIDTTIYGNPEMEAKWDETIKRFYAHRKESNKVLSFTIDGKQYSVKPDTIVDYPEYEADAHFLNLDEYKTYLELVTAYDLAEIYQKGAGLKCVEQNFDFFTTNPKFKEAYDKLKSEQGQEAADKLLLEYINEKKEYVKTFHGLTNKHAVKAAKLKTAGSTLTAMKPVRGNLPTPVKLGNAASNVFRFAGLRLPHFHQVDSKGNKVLDIPGGVATLLVDGLVIGAGALAVASGPVGIATLASAYAVRGVVTAGNVIAGNNYYKKHKDVIDAGLPTIGEPPEYTKEVARREYYRQKVMEESGKNTVGLGRRFTTWFHAKTDRLPFRKASREAGNKALADQAFGSIETEITTDANDRILVAERNAEQARENREIRKQNFKAESRSAGTYNEVLRDPNRDNIEQMASNVATNAAVKAQGSNLRVDVAKGTVGLAEQVEAGRYKKPDEELKKTKGMEVIPDERSTMSAVTAITEEQHYKGEKEHRDFWNSVMVTVGSMAVGMGIRAANKKFTEQKMTDPGTKGKQETIHHDEVKDKKWVEAKKETQNVEKEVTDYGTQYDVKGKKLDDVVSSNKGKTVTGYRTVSGGERGAAQYTINGDEKITAMWQDDLSKWGTGVGDKDGLNQKTGFIDRTVPSGMLDGNGVMRQELTVDELMQAVGAGKVDPATLKGTYVSLGDNYWVPLKDLMKDMTTQVKVGSHIETIPTEVVTQPAHWEEQVIKEAWDEVVTTQGTPAKYKDVVNWEAVLTGLGRSALDGAGAVVANPLHEAAHETYTTSVGALGDEGGTFVHRNPILARNQAIMTKLVEQQKEAVMASRKKEKAPRAQRREDGQDSDHSDR